MNKTDDKRARADKLADALRAAGFEVERKDYRAGGFNIGSRHYVIVKTTTCRYETQINNKVDGRRFAGWSGERDEQVLEAINAIAAEVSQ